MSYDDFFIWLKKRESLINPQDSDFWAYKDNYKMSMEMLKDLENYLTEDMMAILVYNLAAHYIIEQDYELEDGSKNPLYEKYDIANKSSGLIASASDEGSSANYHLPEFLNSMDLMAMDLMSTPYGKKAYSILLQLNIMPVLL